MSYPHPPPERNKWPCTREEREYDTVAKITIKMQAEKSTVLFFQLSVILVIFILREELPHVIILGSAALPGQDISLVVY